MSQQRDCTSGQLVRYFLRLGTWGFGGPIALAGYMQRDLVDRRGWISRQDYLEGLALAQLAPGPLAAQLAMYLGWVRFGVRGATLVSLAFILPSFAMVLALAWLYLRYNGLSWMQGAFHGVGLQSHTGRVAFRAIRVCPGAASPALPETSAAKTIVVLRTAPAATPARGPRGVSERGRR
jgi:chromate transport protein ChrA